MGNGENKLIRTLFEEKNSSIWIKIDIYLTDEEKILVHGCDSGEIVKKLKQQFDYEYYLTIEKEEIQLLMDKLKLNSPEELIDWFVDNYSINGAVSKIKELLGKMEVSYKFMVW